MRELHAVSGPSAPRRAGDEKDSNWDSQHSPTPGTGLLDRDRSKTAYSIISVDKVGRILLTTTV